MHLVLLSYHPEEWPYAVAALVAALLMAWMEYGGKARRARR